MQIIVTPDYNSLCKKAAELIVRQVKVNPTSVLGLATGATPLGLYVSLINSCSRGEVSFKGVRTFNLDDWVGLPRLSHDSFYSYMHQHFFASVDVQPENIYLLDGTASNLSDECINYERYLDEVGGIDVQILGIGLDGHIGFCEPGTSFESHTLVVDLTLETRQSNIGTLPNLAAVPLRGITMGIATIMAARKIILLANGRHKTAILHQALYGPVSEAVPASILQRHPDCVVIMDAAAAGE